MPLPHWNYFLAAEDDIDTLSRYIEFSSLNYATFSLEIARILMSSVQEMDVLFKQICDLKGSPGNSENHYRTTIPVLYPNLPSVEVTFAKFDLKFVPFASWATSPTSTTPSWWTANNKVKHHRHTDFYQASLENALNALAGLLIANLYFHDAAGLIDGLFPGPKHLHADKTVKSVTPTAFGMVPNFKVP